MKAWKKERENIEDKYMKVHNLGKEIDNLHKNIVNVEDKRGIKTSARDDIVRCQFRFDYRRTEET